MDSIRWMICGGFQLKNQPTPRAMELLELFVQIKDFLCDCIGMVG